MKNTFDEKRSLKETPRQFVRRPTDAAVLVQELAPGIRIRTFFEIQKAIS